MRETISIHVGQCGNQIGQTFWNLLLLEHENTPDDDAALSAFFYRVKKDRRNYALKARALLIDMECGPLNEVMKSPLGELFDETQYIMDVSGAGNNFAQGHYYYGPQYQSHIEEQLRKQSERCESIQSFLVSHSLGGGTGSGLGTYLLGNVLANNYPKVTRLSTSVFPSEDTNDVITSPYNTLFATRELIEYTHCCFPCDNAALFNFSKLEQPNQDKGSSSHDNDGTATNKKKSKSKGFENINTLIARMLCHLTSSSRFHGEMNVDLNEIYTNLVPFPRMHFLMTAMNIRVNNAATANKRNIITSNNPNNSHNATLGNNNGSSSSSSVVQRAFSDLISLRGQITGSNPMTSYHSILLQQQMSSHSTSHEYPPVCLASAFMSRGNIRLSEFINGVKTCQKSLTFPSWNQDACKIGMCSRAAPGEEMSLMGVYNSTAFGHILTRELHNFQRLFRVKAMLHHYTEYTEEDNLRQAEYEVSELLADYAALEKSTALQNSVEEQPYGMEECTFPRENSRIANEVKTYHKALADHPFPIF